VPTERREEKRQRKSESTAKDFIDFLFEVQTQKPVCLVQHLRPSHRPYLINNHDKAVSFCNYEFEEVIHRTRYLRAFREKPRVFSRW
jgi:hypothetical protein